MGCSSSKAVVKAPEEVPNSVPNPTAQKKVAAASPPEESRTREIMASVKERVQEEKAQQEQTFMAKETVMSDVEPVTRVDELVTDEPESRPVIIPPIKKKEERATEEPPVCMTREEQEEPVKDEPKEEEPAEAAKESNVKQQQEAAADESTPVKPNQEGPVMLVPSTKEFTKKLNDDDSVRLEETAANHGILVVEQVQMTKVLPHEKEVVQKEEDSWQEEMAPPLKAGATDDDAPAAEQEMTATVMNAAASLLEPSLAEKDGQPVAESPVKSMKKGSTTRVESALYPAIQEFISSGVKATPPAQETALYPAVQEFILGNHLVLADGSKGAMEQQQQEEYDEKGMDVVVVETREKIDVETLKAEAQEAAEETQVETGEKSTKKDSSHVSEEEKVSDVIKSPPSLVKAPDPRANFSNNKSKMERASIAELRTKAGVQKNKKLFDSNVPPPKVDASGNAISSTIDQFVVKKEADSWQDEMAPLEAGADDDAPAEQEMTATVINAASLEPVEELPASVSVIVSSLATEKDGDEEQPFAESPVKNMDKGSTTVESALYPAIQEFILSGVKATTPAEAALYPGVQEFILGNHLALDGTKGAMEQQQEEYHEKGMDVVVIETREKNDVETPKAEAQEAAEETHVETGEKSTKKDSSHVSKEDKVRDVIIKSPPSLVKAPDPRANFSNKSKMERASIVELRTKAGVQKNKKLFDSNVPPPKVDASGNAISSTIDKFGGNEKITAVQRRKLELEQREKENKEAADPKSQIKTSWNTAGRPGAYKKKMQHKKGPRSKKNLADLP